ncbi:MAG TPA: hypothetical protein DHW82_01220 [Spirochaetia bacterium]|nr:MAG: hypothetical protein A2Y41_04680 [Spirochaetes bacterium GWB1_36_13]HCL55617.1 hypothetical protein [Spirochaetia bacterium]
MVLEFLYLKNFKIYPEFEISPHPSFNFFIGPNGSGKTTVLESISLLLSGKSFKNMSDLHLIRHGEKDFYAACRLKEDGVSSRLEIKFESRKKNKELLLDQKKVTSYKELLIRFPFVFSISEDHEIITGSPDSRRRFFDRLISYVDPAYFDQLLRYQNVLKQRNAVLKKHETALLAFWDEELIRLSRQISRTRQHYVQEINLLFKEYKNLPKTFENVHFTYTPSCHENEMETQLIKNVKKDLILGYTSVGIHRDDFLLSYDFGLARNYASQGQLKSLSFYLKFLQAVMIQKKTERNPVFLLDDVFSELDSENRKKMLELAGETGLQIFLSATKEDLPFNLLDSIPHQIFKINNRQVNPQ